MVGRLGVPAATREAWEVVDEGVEDEVGGVERGIWVLLLEGLFVVAAAVVAVAALLPLFKG